MRKLKEVWPGNLPVIPIKWRGGVWRSMVPSQQFRGDAWKENYREARGRIQNSFAARELCQGSGVLVKALEESGIYVFKFKNAEINESWPGNIPVVQSVIETGIKNNVWLFVAAPEEVYETNDLHIKKLLRNKGAGAYQRVREAFVPMPGSQCGSSRISCKNPRLASAPAFMRQAFEEVPDVWNRYMEQAETAHLVNSYGSYSDYIGEGYKKIVALMEAGDFQGVYLRLAKCDPGLFDLGIGAEDTEVLNRRVFNHCSFSVRNKQFHKWSKKYVEYLVKDFSLVGSCDGYKYGYAFLLERLAGKNRMELFTKFNEWLKKSV